MGIGLTVGFIDVLRFEWHSKWIQENTLPAVWWSIINVVSVGLMVGLVVGLMVVGLGDRLMVGLMVGLGGGLIFGLRGSRQSLINDIQAVEAVRWSWPKALKGCLIFGLIGVLSGVLIGEMSVGLRQRLGDSLSVEQFTGLMGGLMGGLFGASFSGLSRELIETKSSPNQGIVLRYLRGVDFWTDLWTDLWTDRLAECWEDKWADCWTK